MPRAIQPDEERQGLSPPQFGISSLLVLMLICGLVFALMDVLGPYGAFWLIVFVLAVFAHVAGNALGSRLREAGSHPLPDEDGKTPARIRPTEITYAPATGLSRKASLGWPLMLATLVGTIGGAVLGGYWLLFILATEFSLPTIIVAILAFAVLGGIWSFLSLSFTQVAFGAARQAQRDPHASDSARRQAPPAKPRAAPVDPPDSVTPQGPSDGQPPAQEDSAATS